MHLMTKMALWRPAQELTSVILLRAQG